MEFSAKRTLQVRKLNDSHTRSLMPDDPAMGQQLLPLGMVLRLGECRAFRRGAVGNKLATGHR